MVLAEADTDRRCRRRLRRRIDNSAFSMSRRSKNSFLSNTFRTNSFSSIRRSGRPECNRRTYAFPAAKAASSCQGIAHARQEQRQDNQCKASMMRPNPEEVQP